jgi:hypothetical protein
MIILTSYLFTIVQELSECYDTDGDGQISLLEFKKFLMSRNNIDKKKWITFNDFIDDKNKNNDETNMDTNNDNDDNIYNDDNGSNRNKKILNDSRYKVNTDLNRIEYDDNDDNYSNNENDDDDNNYTNDYQNDNFQNNKTFYNDEPSPSSSPYKNTETKSSYKNTKINSKNEIKGQKFLLNIYKILLRKAKDLKNLNKIPSGIDRYLHTSILLDNIAKYLLKKDFTKKIDFRSFCLVLTKYSYPAGNIPIHTESLKLIYDGCIDDTGIFDVDILCDIVFFKGGSRVNKFGFLQPVKAIHDTGIYIYVYIHICVLLMTITLLHD